MSVQRFIAQLEKLGVVEEKLIARIRKQVADPNKNVTERSIAKYLVEKGELTRGQAKKLMRMHESSMGRQTLQEEELRPEEPAIDETDMLIAGAQHQKNSASASDATRMDFQELVTDQPEVVDVDQVDSVHEVDLDQIEAIENTEGVPMMTSAQPATSSQQAYHDPFADPFAQPEASTETDVPVGFAGKRVAGDQWKSKWLLIGPTVIGVLAILAVLLVFWFWKTPADDTWKRAEEAHIQGEYSVAMDEYDRFMKDYPNEDRFDLARVYKIRSLLAQSFDAKQWDETYRRSSEELPKIEELEEFNDIRETLATVLPETARGFADQALKEDDIEAKKEIRDKLNQAWELVETPTYIPSTLRKRPVTQKVIDDIEDKRREINHQIQREEKYASSLEQIESLTSAGQTNEALGIYQSLTASYPSLRPREELQAAITKASEAEQKNVKPIDATKVPLTDEIESAIEQTIILARQSGETAIGLETELFPVLVDGSVFVLSGADGKVLWRRHVGFLTQQQPIWIDSSHQRLIVSDAHRNEIICVQAETGKLVWRQVIGSGFQQPQVTGDSVLVTTVDGRLLKFATENGTQQAGAQLPQQTSTLACTSNEFVYQPGHHTNLYVFSADDLRCENVIFVGPDHVEQAVSVPPHIVSDFLLLLVNGADYANLHVYQIQENGRKLVEVQTESRFINGQVNTPMFQIGRWVAIASDTGDLKLLDVTKAEDQDPVSVAAGYRFAVSDTSAGRMEMTGMRHFLMADSGRIWIANQGLSRLRIIKSQRKFRRELISYGNDALFVR